jgi:hypothetical protein
MLGLAPAPDPAPQEGDRLERHVVIALCAEQGFAGTFTERVLDAGAPFGGGWGGTLRAMRSRQKPSSICRPTKSSRPETPRNPRLSPQISPAVAKHAPDVDQKRDIVQNAIILARAIGVQKPKVAILAAIENVNSKMPVTLDAAALAKMADRRQIVGGAVDGPLDLDIAVDEKAAPDQGVDTPVAGKADILIARNIEAGNMMYA